VGVIILDVIKNNISSLKDNNKKRVEKGERPCPGRLQKMNRK